MIVIGKNIKKIEKTRRKMNRKKKTKEMMVIMTLMLIAKMLIKLSLHAGNGLKDGWRWAGTYL